ncbi:MAG: phage tail tape measure protein, partial [Chitinispirillales bacterium]|nr:phage tail tape measure protein [Chitinispirillales bacterium]
MAVELPKVDGADPQKVWRDIAIAANAAGVSGTRMGKAYEEAAKVMAGRMSELEKRFRVGEASQAGYNASMQNIVKTFENGKKLIEQYESPLEKYRRKLAEISEAQQSGIIDQKTYNAALADMKSELDDTEKHFGMSRTAILAWGSSAVEAGSAVARELVRTAESISETAKAAESAGVSSKGFVELGYAAKQAGVDAGMLNGAFIEINDSIVNSSDKFTELGIKVKDTAGNFRSADEVLYDLADNLSGAAVGSKESAAAMELLGKHNAALLPMFKDGSEGLRKMADEAQRLGLVFDKDTGHAAELFSANMTRLSSISDGLRIQ